MIVLPDTSLCAIVRDEKMNPAGGVVDFVDSTMPFDNFLHEPKKKDRKIVPVSINKAE